VRRRKPTRYPRRSLREAVQKSDLAFCDETFPFHTRYRHESQVTTGMTLMSKRVKVQEMVMQMHEKNLVLVNILRDIVENETSYHLNGNEEDEELYRVLADKAARRREILGEIFNFLRKEDMARRVNA
jgi:hypothetical protein